MSELSHQVGPVLRMSAQYLSDRQISDGRLLCEMLMARLLRVSRLALGQHSERELSAAQVEAMRRGLKRLSQHEPVQYVLGEVGFMDHVFKVDSRALIPRPETEVLVRYVLAKEDIWASDQPAIADIGTGTGCIVLSLAAARPGGHFLAFDVSAEALALAKENAVRLELADKVAFTDRELSDVVEPEMLDAIVANLPYITSSEMNELPANVREYEPIMALDGGADGLDVIRTVVADATIVLKNGGWIFLEIGERQGAAVQGLLEESGFENVELIRDLNQRDRIVVGQMPSVDLL